MGNIYQDRTEQNRTGRCIRRPVSLWLREGNGNFFLHLISLGISGAEKVLRHVPQKQQRTQDDGQRGNGSNRSNSQRRAKARQTKASRVESSRGDVSVANSLSSVSVCIPCVCVCVFVCACVCVAKEIAS